MKKHDDNQDNSTQGTSNIKRREFIKRAGLASTAVALGALLPRDTLSRAAGVALKRRQLAGLGDSTAAMVWRAVSGNHIKPFIENAIGWPLLGENPAVLMYDAGGMIVGFSKQMGSAESPEPESTNTSSVEPTPLKITLAPSFQTIELGRTFLLNIKLSEARPFDIPVFVSSSNPRVASAPDSVALRAGELSVAIPVTGNTIAQATITARLPENFGGSTATSQVAVEKQCVAPPAKQMSFGSSNLASEIVLHPSSFSNSVKKLNEVHGTSVNRIKPPNGATLPFLDTDGNLFSLHHFSDNSLDSKAELKVRDMLAKQRVAEKLSVTARIANPMVGLTFLVSDLSSSTQYYKETLGLRMLESSKTEAKFDIGNVILTLQAESTVGLVKCLAKSGRLAGDSLAFHTDDIEPLVQSLTGRGVRFAAPINESPIGRVTYFLDPDGHSLGIWMPSGNHKGIDFYPALNRMLA